LSGDTGALLVSLGAAADLFLAAKAAEGLSPRTIEWYRMIIGRAVACLGPDRPLNRIPAAELRIWLLELRSTLSAESITSFHSAAHGPTPRRWNRRMPRTSLIWPNTDSTIAARRR
jgi:hypothetical protein